MAGEEQGRIPFAADLLQERHGRRGVLWIERRRWLVREDHRRVPDQCPSDRHPLLLPHAQAINPDGRVGDSQSREQRIGDRRVLRGPDSAEEEGDRDVFPRGKSGKQVVRLEDHADSVGTNGIPTATPGIGDRFSRKLDLARVGVKQAGGE